MEQAHKQCMSRGWLDKIAISMAAVCAVHCLLTPMIIVLLPIVATSFFVHQDFHLWMLFLVIPTTAMAVGMGCRKHKDKWVAAMSAIGLSILLAAVVYERQQHVKAVAVGDCSTVCAHCTASVGEAPLHAAAWINVMGGLFLASAHVRNYRLCRKARCEHEH
jgi:hypothetical protein